MMEKLVSLDKNYSTTQLLSQRKPEIVNEPGDKVKSVLFLPPHPERKGEGGLRTRGYFKFSYEIENGRWYACDFRGRRLFEVEPPREISLDLEEFRTKDGVVRLPLVSIVTVVLNGEKYLEETIQSVINQTYPDVEYIIIDGGSTDGTLDIIKKYEDKIDYWVSEKDRGIYDGMNKGIDLANGEWLNFMNAGDRFITEISIKNIVPVLEDDVIIGKTLIFETNKVSFPRFFYEILIRNKACHQSTFFRNIRFKFDLKYKYLSDYHMLLKFILTKKKIKLVDHVISVYRTNGVSSCGDNSKEELELKRELSFFLYLLCRLKLFLKRLVNRRMKD